MVAPMNDRNKALENQQEVPVTHGLWIGGRWCEATFGKTIDFYNAASGRVFSTISAGNGQDVDRTVAAARHPFSASVWRGMTTADRGVISASGRSLRLSMKFACEREVFS
ncbi:hypothetical protein [Rhizobium sp. C4]|uniref:hypothetical protein n=1 Tax=Rhizobium sp. C4 TaxID=1349800 RepID=UPI001E607614|nr:hypothetical protein [Rhizobium sp. C4]MCD2176041.1 hypothetical protein [Rhizobium sp. C4]